MNKTDFVVCYGSSNQYVQYTGISMLSLLDNNRGLIDQIYILDYGIEENNRNILLEIAQKNNADLKFIETKNIFNDIQNRYNLSCFRGSMATYSRAFISEILPNTVKRVLYIDSDTVVCGSIEELIELDMKECAVGAVIGMNQYALKRGKLIDTAEIVELLSHNPTYFAMGVVLYDMENWRRNDCDKKIHEVCQIKQNFRYAEQTLINDALPEKNFLPISPKYNYWGHLFNQKIEMRELRKGDFYTPQQIQDVIDNPVIVHYKGEFYQRPWYDKCTSRMPEKFRYYKSISPWKDEPLQSFYAEYKKLPFLRKTCVKCELKKLSVQHVWMLNVISYFERCIDICICWLADKTQK